MLGHLRGNLWLLVLSLLIGCVLYPLTVLGIAKIFFPNQAEGSLIDEKGQPVTDPEKALGSRMIAQPFTADEYFRPRPSAVSYNATASGASNWGASNYLLRDRVARLLGPIVKYRSGSKKGHPVAPDIESWFQKDQFQGRSGLVSQWAQAHSTLAQNWVKADKMNGEYVAAWQKAHPDEVAQWIKDNPDNPEPKPEDLAVLFFTSYSTTFPGTFPGAVEHKTPGGQTEKKIEPVKEGSDIQSVFFDMWRQEHPDEDLEAVPADMVMASGSGLDPDITLKNALYQLDRVAGAWAKKTNGDEGKIRQEIEKLLNEKAEAPLGGLAGVTLVNVLEMNLALRNRFGSQVVPEKVTQTAEEKRPEPTEAAVATKAKDVAEGSPPAVSSPPRAETSAPRVEALASAATVEAAPARPDLASDVAALRTEIGHVSDQLKRLADRLEERAEAIDRAKAAQEGARAELTRLGGQVARLADDSRQFNHSIERLGGLDVRVQSASETLQSLRSEVKEARETLKALGPASSPARAGPR
jgi:potassium-transporting ATPase KdpC subunit